MKNWDIASTAIHDEMIMISITHQVPESYLSQVTNNISKSSMESQIVELRIGKTVSKSFGNTVCEANVWAQELSNHVLFKLVCA